MYLPEAVHYLVENIVDLFTDVGSKSQEFSVYSMQRGFEKVSLARIFAIEQLQKLKHKLLIDEPFGDRRLKIRGLQESQEKLVNQLQVGPSSLSSKLSLKRQRMEGEDSTLHRSRS